MDVNDDGTNYEITFLNSSKNLRDVFAISTGISGLNQLLEIYEKNMKKFKGTGKLSPVVIIIDNDDGADGIKRRLKIKGNETHTHFYHFAENLYVLIIPKNKAIEDLFDSTTLGTKIDGKTFNSKKKIDIKTEYGKYIFAEKVIRPKQKDIDFNGFKEVFDTLKLIVKDYQTKMMDESTHK